MYGQILRLITQLHGDMTRPLINILEDLQGLRDEIDVFIETIEGDIKTHTEE